MAKIEGVYGDSYVHKFIPKHNTWKASLVLTVYISSSYSKWSVMTEADLSFSLRAVSVLIGQRHKWAGLIPLSDVNRGRIWNSSFWETVYDFIRL